MMLPNEIAAKLLSSFVNEQTLALVLVVRDGDQAIVDADLRPLGEVAALLRLASSDDKRDKRRDEPLSGGDA